MDEGSCSAEVTGTVAKPQRQQQQDNEPTTFQAGRRFSLAQGRILNKWLAAHTHHPYPTVMDVELLERESGLSKQQILTWFSNARRRKKLGRAATSNLSSDSSGTGPRNIPPPRPSTPFVEQQTPLERWENSPPEEEPSAFADIARAISDASIASPFRSRHASSSIAGSVNSGETSGSSQSSHASINSQTSDAYFRRSGSIRRLVKKRRRTAKGNSGRNLFQVCHRFQCTFCTETFKTKHTWQRHEKSLHLSLEQWECSPSGPSTLNQQSEPVCVFCGLLNPDSVHSETHNYDFCRERDREERVFYRKDHLRQHLRLVHDSQFSKWPMEGWKLECDDVQSRCGFCDISMTTWTERLDHLAEHFREGKTMADWRGNWGFDSATLEMVENSMPPCLDYFFSNYVDINQCVPPERILHLELCSIIFGAEMLHRHSQPNASSWLRDLLMGTEDIAKEAQMRPMKSAARSRFTDLRIHGKSNIFEDCTLEASLRQYVDMLQMLNLEISDDELQREACSIINHNPNASPMFANLLITLVSRSTTWLTPFRIRTGLSTAEASLCPTNTSTGLGINSGHLLDLTDIRTLGMAKDAQANDATTNPMTTTQILDRANVRVQEQRAMSLNDGNMYRGLTRDLSRFVASLMSPLNPNQHVPTDEELQFQARWIMYDSDDMWNQTPADNPNWLSEFKKECGFFE
ncbi:uncharacterized protein NECHADRAFT_48111 [Fusarium vanettenii 77-13-4]|uniref:Homeobox domain-containing protein n=1 Tax=Fusarium vanettenii (strain ATCC MYA-4622 / CBS 123669 / FGSC 9596 / NRRL 45880 / 77-13-4) TaxID=660122 RepID=C7ZCT3_FUSV7|nr:uncharacterized protein NECHADRAFT_48111 [Fusarium vanettenii 77-13-4]EEU38098.1 hypothetical protein NECHADRAFT_48111 [Fusarium vanettenii 77-13-4]